jgi:hypothetical protein
MPVYGLSEPSCTNIGVAVLGNIAATWRTAGGRAQVCGTESPPIVAARPVNAEGIAALPGLDTSAALSR